MGIRRWLRRVERDSRETGDTSIPQVDGPPVQVSGEQWLQAFSVAVKRMYDKDIPEHPLNTAAANSSDSRWSRSLIAGTHTLPNGAERVGKADPHEDCSE